MEFANLNSDNWPMNCTNCTTKWHALQFLIDITDNTVEHGFGSLDWMRARIYFPDVFFFKYDSNGIRFDAIRASSVLNTHMYTELVTHTTTTNNDSY